MKNKLEKFIGRSYSNVIMMVQDLREEVGHDEFAEADFLRRCWAALDHLTTVNMDRTGLRPAMRIIAAPEGFPDAVIVQFYSTAPAPEGTGAVSIEALIVQDKDAIRLLPTPTCPEEALKRGYVPAPAKMNLTAGKQALNTLLRTKMVDWSKAHELLMADPRFSSIAIKAFKAAAREVKPKDETTPHHVRFVMTDEGADATFMVAGKADLNIKIGFSYAQ